MSTPASPQSDVSISVGIQPLQIPEDIPYSAEDLREVLRLMMVARRPDQKMLTLLKQGKRFFNIGGPGA